MYAISIIAATALNYNLWFAAFNLLPVPPLDGWGVISSFLPYKFRDFEIKYENIGYLVLIVLLVTNLGSYITSPLVKLFCIPSSLSFSKPTDTFLFQKDL